ncbi:Ppx/GppA phosphatase family protein [Millisia brevis]|uniref:Ppx/GppA phosphatase family protein n=1 Tax=Millisia brevis TaxID=264148 RepID=UPI0008330EA6|nr:Ppx/GppA phosphatase family protein [Millisia brevis]
MSRVAAIDCGTNSIRLLVADIGADGALTDIAREMRIVRLGQGVDATGTFADEAIERTRVALEEFVGIIGTTGGVDTVRMVATSATRDAANRDHFFDMTARTLAPVADGAIAEVISGDEEARLSFSGAVGDLDPADGPFLVVDLGGGSTELVLGDADGVTAAYSADVGCVRVTERSLHSDPPTAGEVAAARDFVTERFAPALATVPVKQARTWVGVAGTMTTLAALALDLPAYDRDRIHLSTFSFEQIDAICARLLGMTRAERAGLGPMHPGRVDVIGAGSLITATLATAIAEESLVTGLTVSEHDILDGIALSIVG